MVGIVVLGGLIILGWMLIRFGGRFVSPFAPPYIIVRFVADRADGISNGSPVLYRGVTIGRVEKVSRAPDKLHVFIDTQLDKDPPLPGNVRAVIRAQGIVGGGATLYLELTGALPEGSLSPDQAIETTFIGLELLPDEFTALATELRQTIRQFREANIVTHIDDQVLKLGKLIDSAQEVIGDTKLREDLRASLASLRSTTEKADRIATGLEKFSADLPRISSEATGTLVDLRTTVNKTQTEILSVSKQVNDRLAQLGVILERAQAVADKVNSGQGTIGALVNDAELYQSLVDSAKDLSATSATLRRLLEQWEKEGLPLKLN